jgi:hypothetical protein
MPCRPELALTLTLVLAGGCDPGGDEDEMVETVDPELDEGPWSSLEERPCPPDSILGFDNFGGPFLLDHCTACHSGALPAGMRQNAPPGVDFDTLNDVREWAPRIWARAADQNATMPPVGAPGADERALLGEWLACGAPRG